MSFGSRLMSWRADSRKRCFGNIFCYNVFLTPIIYKHTREIGAMAKLGGQKLLGAPRKPLDQRAGSL